MTVSRETPGRYAPRAAPQRFEVFSPASPTTTMWLGGMLDYAERADLDQYWLYGTSISDERADGWTVNRRPGDWWTRAYKPGGKHRAIVEPAKNVANGQWGAWAAAGSARQLEDALTVFRIAVGQLPERSPGSTAHRILRRLHAQANANHPAPSERLDVKTPSAVGPLVWMQQRGLMPRGQYLHSYDKHGMYLAACASLWLGKGTPELWTEPDVAHLRSGDLILSPGYYYATVDGPWAAGPPPADSRRTRWYPAPALAYLLHAPGWTVDIEAAWVWPERYQPLQPWYSRLREARAQLTRWSEHEGQAADGAVLLALSALKALYTQGIGWFAAQAPAWDRSADPYYRPDWFDHIMTAARANLLRNLAATTLEPIAVVVDCVYVLSDNPDAEAVALDAGLRLGSGLGQYAVKDRAIRTTEVQAFLDASDVPALSSYLNQRRAP